jgi:hypothetical protein
MPQNQFGQTYGQGVKYIKVNRYDSGGLDRSGYLGQLTDLTINYDDLGPIQYNIVTTQEQDTYFVYGIQTRNQVTSSVNFEVLDYSFLATSASSFTYNFIPLGLPNEYFNNIISSYGNVSGNILGYLTASTGRYTAGNTPNVFLKVQISGSGTISGGSINLYAYITKNGGSGLNNGVQSILINNSYTGGVFNTTLYLTSSFSIVENDQIGFGLYRDVSLNSLTISNFHVSLSLFSASVNPATSSLIIFNPEFIDWDYNDYNALFGNADIPQFSNTFMDVDYITNYTTPINFNLIISGTADRALVQDSNYNSYAWSGIRYWGSRYNSYKSPVTKYQFVNTDLNGDFNDLSIDNSGYGKLPAAEQNQTYFAYFDGVGGTGPEVIDKTAYFIKYIIDTEGNVVDPDPNNIGLINLKDNFEVGKNAIVQAPTNVNTNLVGGPFKITHVGRIAPILITETGSGNLDYARTMSFNYLDGSPIAQAVANLTAQYQSNMATTFISNTNWATMNYQNDVYSTQWSNPSTGNYRLDYSGGTLAAATRIRLRVSFFVRKASENTNSFRFRILKNGDTNNVFFTSQAWSVDNTTGWYATAWTDWFDTNQNDYFTVQYKVGTGGTGFQIQMIGTQGGASGTTFTVEQETPSTTGFINGITGTTSSYWTIGEYLTGNNTTVLTGSQFLTNIYLANQAIQSTPTASLSFGFSNIITPFFPIQVGDWIRFQYDENRLHCITKVDVGIQNNNTGSALFLTVVPPVATSSILDHFVLYRIINDGTYVVLDVPKSQSIDLKGFLLPQYVSSTVNSNLDKITEDLKNKNLIS